MLKQALSFDPLCYKLPKVSKSTAFYCPQSNLQPISIFLYILFIAVNYGNPLIKLFIIRVTLMIKTLWPRYTGYRYAFLSR